MFSLRFKSGFNVVLLVKMHKLLKQKYLSKKNKIQTKNNNKTENCSYKIIPKFFIRKNYIYKIQKVQLQKTSILK